MIDVGYRCQGGPFHMQRLNLECPKSGTLKFSCKGMKGFYKFVSHPKGGIAVGSFLKWVSTQ